MSEITAEEVAEIIKNVCTSVVVNKADYNRKFNELGIDSLDLSGILLEIEEKYGTKISDKDAVKITTVSSIVEYLNRNDK